MDLLKTYGTIVNAIAETFGKDCEVVLHDLKCPQRSIIKIANGHVSGRSVGDGIRDLIKTVLVSGESTKGALTGYLTTLPDGRKLRSTTILIKDDKDVLIGALCINNDLTTISKMNNMCVELLNTKKVEVDNEVDDPHLRIYLGDLIEKIINNCGTPVVEMDKGNKIEAIQYMDQKGVFLVKGSVDLVAQYLNVSRYTIYNYLEEARGRK